MFCDIEPRLKIGMFGLGKKVVPIFEQTPESIIAREGWMVCNSGERPFYAREVRHGWKGPKFQLFIFRDDRNVVFVQRYQRLPNANGWVFIGELIGEQVNDHYATRGSLRWISDSPTR